MALSFGGSVSGTIYDAIRDTIEGFEELAIAVSYVQLSGWDLLRPLINSKYHRVRLLCTDQLGITDPKAIRAIIADGVQVRVYTGRYVYHPKVYISSRNGEPPRWALGSANLSKSALQTGVEAISTGNDEDGEALSWFNSIFDNKTLAAQFDNTRLEIMDEAWKARLKSRLTYQQIVESQEPKIIVQTGDNTIEAASIIESAFAGIGSEILPLNIDKAGNTIRNLERIKQILQEPVLDKGKAGRSELKQLGFTFDGKLTELGEEARADGTLPGIARLWTRWLRVAPTQVLREINPTGKLIRGRATFEIFWSFPKEVTEFFLENSLGAEGQDRRICQTIELLANAGQALPQLTLQDAKVIAANLSATTTLRNETSLAISGYLKNKGGRGWKFPDRRLILEAWRNK